MKKYNSAQEFFEEPISKHIEDEVDCQVRIIDSCIAFGEWLSYNTSLDAVGEFHQNGEYVSVAKLFQMYCDELNLSENEE